MAGAIPLPSSRQRWLALANISVGTFMSTLDGSIVNVALPTISNSFQTDLTTLQWVVTAYLLAISSLLLPFGRLGDMISRKKIYAYGLLIFVGGSALCGLATNEWLLVAARVIQGIGAAMIMANGPGIITSVFPPQERGRAIGLIGTVVAAGSLAGPSLGGVLVSTFGWPAIFYVNLPIGIIGFLATGKYLPTDAPNPKQESFDYLGAVTFALAMTFSLLAISKGQELGWASYPIWGSLVIAACLLAFFLYHQLHTPHPMVDFSLFRNRVFWSGNLAGFLSFVTGGSVTIILPFYLHDILHFTPAQMGLMMTPFPLIMAVVAPASGWLSDRIGPIFLGAVGLTINTIAYLLLSALGPLSSSLQVALPLALLGLGMGMFQSPNNSAVLGSVRPHQLGVAGGINALVRNTGMVTGIAFFVFLFTAVRSAHLSGTVPSASESEAFMIGLRTVFQGAAAISLVAIIVSTFRRKKKQDLSPQPSPPRNE